MLIRRYLLMTWIVFVPQISSAQSESVPPVSEYRTDRESRSISLAVGEQTSLPAKGVRSYSEGAPGIVDVRLPKDGSQFIIVALRPGQTTLLLFMMDGSQLQYHIQVSRSDSLSNQGVEVTDNIRLDFYYVQLSETSNQQIGIGWPGTIGGSFKMAASYDLLGGGFQNATAVVADQVLPRLDMAQTNGWAKVMRQAAVITSNGNEAQFASGGEVNVPVQGALTAEIRKIAFGSDIRVLPRYDKRTGRIELQVQADVSDLTDPGADVPGRTTANLRTLVNLELGQSLILAGLNSQSKRTATTGIPGLSQIPLLGLLFGSTGEQEENIENLVFIVPSVVDAVSLQSRDRIGEAMTIYDEFSGDVDEIDMLGPIKRTPRPSYIETPKR
ncbi:MAG: pilus assembly protein N-terminal domain-containing protein [Myxococcales bacterium]|nr:pilus assembly protein N-terminal domain-containing protein [Myxococcales bacterium]MCB9707396.1 pilus assembly protein N-terminal domain-containing protein [Myxococcales bacterium]